MQPEEFVQQLQEDLDSADKEVHPPSSRLPLSTVSCSITVTRDCASDPIVNCFVMGQCCEGTAEAAEAAECEMGAEAAECEMGAEAAEAAEGAEAAEAAAGAEGAESEMEV